MSVQPLATDHFSIQIVSITGGLPFQLIMNKTDTVDDLKKAICLKVKVRKEKICLLFLDKELVDGTIEENNIVDGSTVKFVPRTETGMMAPTPEDTAVIQALESLSEEQVRLGVPFCRNENSITHFTGYGLLVRGLPTKHDDETG